MRQPNAMTGDSSEFLKGQMVVQRFRPLLRRPRRRGLRRLPGPSRSSGNSYASPCPVSYVTGRPVGDVTPVSVIRDAVPCVFDGAQESRLFRNKSDPAEFGRETGLQTPTSARSEPRRLR